MSVIIADDSMRGSEKRENILFQELDNNLIVIHSARNCFNPLGHIVTATKMYWFPNELEKRLMKSMPQILKTFISRIGLRGIMLQFEILPTIGHLGHILQNSKHLEIKWANRIHFVTLFQQSCGDQSVHYI